jgi:hypothetical protein
MTDEPPGGFLTLGDLEATAAARVPENIWAFVQGGRARRRRSARIATPSTEGRSDPGS